MIKTHKIITLIYARRCISYYGQIKHSDSVKFCKKISCVRCNKNMQESGEKL